MKGAANARLGPWWLVAAPTRAGPIVVKFKVVGGRPMLIQLCGTPPPGPWPSHLTLRRAAERFCRRHADIIAVATALKERGFADAGPYAPVAA